MRLVSILSVVLLLAACDATTTEQEKPAEAVFEKFDTTPFSLYETTGNCDSDTSRTCTRVNVEYPILSDSLRAEAAAKINKTLANQAANNLTNDSVPYASVESMASEFIQTYEEVVSDFPESFGWEININGDVMRNDANYVVIKMESYSYAGGAHGNSSVKYTTFSSESGDVLTLDELLADGYTNTLNQLALNAFRESRDLPPDADPETAGYTFENNRYFNPENFAFLDNQLIFYFNHYQIAPYSAGPTQLYIPLDQLKVRGAEKDNRNK